jgi:hypothetical protein
MTGMKSNTDHESRLDWWRKQFQRQAKTNPTIAGICRWLTGRSSLNSLGLPARIEEKRKFLQTKLNM